MVPAVPSTSKVFVPLLNQTCPGIGEEGEDPTTGNTKVALLAMAKLPLSIVAMLTEPLLIVN
jgi:hypothetical protein